jgi:ferritin-like metal-binding protein YciE
MEEKITISTLHELLNYEASRFENAEIRLKIVMQEWVKLANSMQLKLVLQKYLDFIAQHITKMQGYYSSEEFTDLSLNNPILVALISDAEEKISFCTDIEVKDACLLAVTQSINHYKIYAYGTAAAYANALGMNKESSLFREVEINEKHIDDRLSQLAAYEINEKAKSPIKID